MKAKYFKRKQFILFTVFISVLITGCAGGYKQKAESYLKSGRFDEAIETYRKALQDSPDDSDAHIGLGKAYFSKVMNFNQANIIANIATAPFFSYSKESLQQHLQTDMLDESLSEFKKAIKLDPSNADAHYWLGYVYYFKLMPGEAVDEARETIALKPNNGDAHYLLSWSYIMQAKDLLNTDRGLRADDSVMDKALSILESAKKEVDETVKLKPSFRSITKEQEQEIAYLTSVINRRKAQKAEMSKKLSEIAAQAKQGVYKSSW